MIRRIDGEGREEEKLPFGKKIRNLPNIVEVARKDEVSRMLRRYTLLSGD